MNLFKEPKPILFTLIFIGICAGLLDYFLPPSGDDLKFWTELGQSDYTFPDRSTLSFIAGHIEGCNARFLQFMGPVMINLLPRGLAAVVMGLMIGFYFYVMVINADDGELGMYGAKKSGIKHISIMLLFIAVTLAVMPWWDSMWLRVCHYNYIWATAFCLLFTVLFFKEQHGFSKIGIFGLFILGFLVGGTHEQTGLSMFIAILCWIVFGKKWSAIDFRRKTMLWGVVFGLILELASPGFWNRIDNSLIPDDTIHLILTTLPIYILLLLTLGFIWVNKGGREFLQKAFKGDMIVLLAAASFAAVIAVYSGIPGRTGWFTESCSLVIWARMAFVSNFRITKMFGVAISVVALLFVAAHYVVSIIGQREAYIQHEAVKELFLKSGDGVVFYDYTGRFDFPTITLNRIKGVEDADDIWSRFVMSFAYGNKQKELFVLPTAFRGKIPLDEDVDSLTFNRVTVYKECPTHTYLTRDSLSLQNWTGETRVIRESPRGWIATPLVVDPGDYH